MSVPSHSASGTPSSASAAATPHLTARAATMLTVAPLLWAGNAVVGRALNPLIPPVTLNLLRWVLACLILLPFAGGVLRPGSPLWAHWKRFSLLGLLGIGCYNMLQYMALRTSTPVNVTLVASSMPLGMMLVGRLFYDVPITRPKLWGAALSLAGVLLVLSRGSWGNLLHLHLVVGDLFMLAATLCWSFYSWMLMHTREPAGLRGDWKAFLLAQIALGVVWSLFFTGIEWAVEPDLHIVWSPALWAGLAYVAIGPAILAFAFWGMGVQQAGPTIGSFFTNLTPVFAALLSAFFLGESPAWFHAVAFVLIVAGIVVSSRH